MALLAFDNFYTLTRIQKKQLAFFIDEYVSFPKYGEGRFTVVIIWKWVLNEQRSPMSLLRRPLSKT